MLKRSRDARNDMIFNDVLSALEAGRSPVVITERKDHLQAIAERLTKCQKRHRPEGGMGAKQGNRVNDAPQSVPEGEKRVIVASGRYLGEGFDDARLDALFLTMPISWRGALVQYTGRLHRLHAAKREVIFFDYVDGDEPRQNGQQTRGWLPRPWIRSGRRPAICFHSARCDEKRLIWGLPQRGAGQRREPSLVPSTLKLLDFSNGYGDPDSWFESRSLRHELSR
jgi:superfamily II DNA or RNA helicase